MSKPENNWQRDNVRESAWNLMRVRAAMQKADREERQRRKAELCAEQQAAIDDLLSHGLNGQPVIVPSRSVRLRYVGRRYW